MFLLENTVLISSARISPLFFRTVSWFQLFQVVASCSSSLWYKVSYICGVKDQGFVIITGLPVVHYFTEMFDFISFYFLNWVSDMLPGLKQGQEKMSKSDPNSAIFMEDEEVR